MLFADHLVVIRGGGDLATGAALRLHRAGFPVVVLELAPPLTVRRAAAVSSAVTDGSVTVDGMVAVRAGSLSEAVESAQSGSVAVYVSPELPNLQRPAEVVVDGRIAKHNIDTTRDQAPLVVALGPGFTAGEDCDAVVETQRGPHLGRVLWSGSAAADTGVPGSIGGEDERRVLRAERPGVVRWNVAIGDHVWQEQAIGTVGDGPIHALTSGVVRGLIAEGFEAPRGLKIGDIDPRADAAACFEVSDKALAVGGGVLEAVLSHLNRLS